MEPEQPDDGNVSPPDGGNEQLADGTPEGDGRNAGTDGNIAQLNKQLQEKASRVNAAEAAAARAQAERDAYKSHLEALTRSQSPAANGGDADAQERALVEGLARGAYGDVGPDPVAARVLRAEKRSELLEQKLEMALNEVANLRELDRVQDDAKRDKIKEHFNANRHRLGDVAAARAEIDAKELTEQLAQEREASDKLRKALEATSRKQNPDVVRTHATEVSAAETQAREMTRAEWESEQARLLRTWEETGDKNARDERLRKQRDYAAGKIKVGTKQ